MVQKTDVHNINQPSQKKKKVSFAIQTQDCTFRTENEMVLSSTFFFLFERKTMKADLMPCFLVRFGVHPCVPLHRNARPSVTA